MITILEMLRGEPERLRQQQLRHDEARHQAELEQRDREAAAARGKLLVARREARGAQLKRTAEVADECVQRDRVTALLDALRERFGELDEREAIAVSRWIALVNEQLRDAVSVLMSALQREARASEKPLWFPES